MPSPSRQCPRMSGSGKTHFGFEEVPVADKARRVAGVFSSVAGNYDLMNDLMSFGIHRLWKRFALAQTGLKPGQRALDLAGGTGDLARGLAAQVGETGAVVLADINAAMLERGRNRLLDAGVIGNIGFVQADAEHLPFPERRFDCITIAFGLRNVTRKEAALQNMFRVLKPGGRLLVLEFSKPVSAGLRRVYDQYSFKLLPQLGKWVAKDEASYRYLAESIRMHPDQATLRDMMQAAGFERCDYFNLSGGIVALHRGFRL
ncbi:MAG TPA: bifunctional demethylmenaquinone methyltransferase/2-methoxy-6-polyprenyl-1,4-benzoquinol methylase UbiE [Gammaproteobacteria bacterium]|nr:bifunctional demethylmenaquinone methyltransferase/2-methoxy-6-polyprenyl-1,4-benzoquinol methylase UbiE [Gammaproteobacteria bacterium]